MRWGSNKGFGCTTHTLEEKQPVLDWLDTLTDEQAEQLRVLIRERFYAIGTSDRDVCCSIVEDFVEDHGGLRHWFVI